MTVMTIPPIPVARLTGACRVYGYTLAAGLCAHGRYVVIDATIPDDPDVAPPEPLHFHVRQNPDGVPVGLMTHPCRSHDIPTSAWYRMRCYGWAP